MKIFLILTSLIVSSLTIAQKPFEKDGKWGVSRDGTGESTDSIITRADYEKIEVVESFAGNKFAGFRNDEWIWLTNNKLVNQQRYERIGVVEHNDEFIYGYRDGYYDFINASKEDFQVRGVQADAIADGADYLQGDNSLMMTQKGKDLFGIVNLREGKEVLKAEYTSIRGMSDVDDVAFLAYKNGTNVFADATGKVLFSFESDLVITSMSMFEEIEQGYWLVVEGKKSATYGMYDRIENRFIPPIYTDDLYTLDGTSDATVVIDQKGNKGLYFLGKQMLACEYLEIVKSEKQGVIAEVSTRKGTFYLEPDGNMRPVK